MTKFQKYVSLFIAICLLILVIGVSCKISNHRGYKAGWDEALLSIKPDTLVVTDTVRIDKPVVVEKWVEKDRPVYIAVHDTTRINDTTFVVLPREVKQYADSTYCAQVSGVQPSLDWIQVYPKTTVISKPIPEYKYPELIVSPAASVEILPMSLFAGAGISADYWTGRFQFSAEIGYGINNILGQVPASGSGSALEIESKVLGSKAGIYGKLGAKLNLIRK